MKMNKIEHKVIDNLVKGGSNEREAIQMVSTFFDEVVSLYPDIGKRPAKIACYIRIAAS
jgi:hypothetical protein